MTILPVDRIIPEIHAALETAPTVIIQAPPGSGKSTRIPASLLNSTLLSRNKIVMLEPRRLAALNLATWISSCMGEKVGETVGYSVRFDRKTSSGTRLEIMTEGVLTRRLQGDPFLESVGAVIFDEFHERSIHTDTSLALCLYLQRTVRPDLKILIMSATLETRSVAKIIPDAKIITCDGALHPVEIRYLGTLDEDCAKSVAKAVAIALNENSGDILVFLPGAAEIRRCRSILQQNFPSGELLILPLYGDLSFADQEKAIRISDKRKIVLATNIAETSITIEGVTVVVDSGLARRSKFDPARALDRLVTERISQASSTQRAGRSGRTAPGVCYRLWSEYQQSVMLSFDLPEILTADLSGLALNLALWGFHDLSEIFFPDQPSLSSLGEARRTLRLLSALDDNDRITRKGKRMAGLPLHPRIAALLLSACDEGNGCMGCDIAAILSEKDFLRSLQGSVATSSDILDRLEILIQWRANPEILKIKGEADLPSIRSVERLSSQLRKILSISAVHYKPSADAVSLLAATAFPDRIAMQREPGSRRYLLANGGGASLDVKSGLLGQKFIVAIRLDAGIDHDGKIFSGSALVYEQIRDKFAGSIISRRTAIWDTVLKRVVVREEELLGALVLESRPVKATREDVVNALLENLRSSDDSGILIKSALSDQYQARVGLVCSLSPEGDWPDLTDRKVLQTAEEWLPSSIDSMDHPEKFRGVDLLFVYRGALGRQREAALDRLLPATISVPSGSRIKIDYSGDGGPSISVKLQELFGLGDSPRIANGKIVLLIHLLSPAGRPIQITKDLQSFWNSGYPDVKKELKGRYPRHPWPDDPWSAIPTKSLKKRTGS